MIVQCPECSSRYRYPDDRIGTDGTSLICFRCRSVLLAHPPRKSNGAASEPTTGPLGTVADRRGASRIVGERHLSEVQLPDTVLAPATVEGRLTVDRYNPRGKRWLGPLVAMLTVLVAVTVGFIAIDYFVVTEGYELTEVVGEVLKRKGVNAWVVARKGDHIDMQETLKTGRESRAVLNLAGGSTLAIGEESSVEVIGVDAEKTDIAVSGQMKAKIRHRRIGKSRKLVVQSRDAMTKVSATEGVFYIDLQPTGLTRISSEAGDVTISHGNKVLTLIPKRMATIDRKSAGNVVQIGSAEVLLKVDWPQENLLTTKRLTIAGQTEAGNRLLANGVRIEVEPDGHFSATIPLAEGKNRIELVAEDVRLGRRAVVHSPEYLVDLRGPAVRKTGKTQWQ